MKDPFKRYLINVGIRSSEYTYTDEQILNSVEHFEKCFQDGLSAYKALLYFEDYLDGNIQEIPITDNIVLPIGTVVNIKNDAENFLDDAGKQKTITGYRIWNGRTKGGYELDGDKDELWLNEDFI